MFARLWHDDEPDAERDFTTGWFTVYRAFEQWLCDGQQDFQFLSSAVDKSDCITTDTNGSYSPGCNMEKQSNHH
jgi:hypothetical protein